MLLLKIEQLKSKVKELKGIVREKQLLVTQKAVDLTSESEERRSKIEVLRNRLWRLKDYAHVTEKIKQRDEWKRNFDKELRPLKIESSSVKCDVMFNPKGKQPI